MFLFNSSFSTDINGPLDIHKQRLERLVSVEFPGEGCNDTTDPGAAVLLWDVG